MTQPPAPWREVPRPADLASSFIVTGTLTLGVAPIYVITCTSAGQTRPGRTRARAAAILALLAAHALKAW